MRIDETDRGILEEYQKDASVSYNELAEKLGIPSSTVFSRIRRMNEAGIIKGIVPLVDASALGKGTTAWIMVELESGTDCCEFADEIAEWDEIMEVYELAGGWDLMLKVKIEDNEALHILSKRVNRMPGVHKTSSVIALRNVKEDPRISL